MDIRGGDTLCVAARPLEAVLEVLPAPESLGERR
jgi:hypothetical protein